MVDCTTTIVTHKGLILSSLLFGAVLNNPATQKMKRMVICHSNVGNPYIFVKPQDIDHSKSKHADASLSPMTYQSILVKFCVPTTVVVHDLGSIMDIMDKQPATKSSSLQIVGTRRTRCNIPVVKERTRGSLALIEDDDSDSKTSKPKRVKVKVSPASSSSSSLVSRSSTSSNLGNGQCYVVEDDIFIRTSSRPAVTCSSSSTCYVTATSADQSRVVTTNPTNNQSITMGYVATSSHAATHSGLLSTSSSDGSRHGWIWDCK